MTPREYPGAFDEIPDVRLPWWRQGAITAAELQTKQFPPLRFVVPDLIPEGLTLLAGKPKVGKSWMVLDIAIAVASGRYTLGNLKPEQGDVLYLALEDGGRDDCYFVLSGSA